MCTKICELVNFSEAMPILYSLFPFTCVGRNPFLIVPIPKAFGISSLFPKQYTSTRGKVKLRTMLSVFKVRQIYVFISQP